MSDQGLGHQLRFATLWQRLNGGGPVTELYTSLADAYAEPQRAYHTMAHLQACLTQFDQVRPALRQPDAVEIALWFHDAVYDPHATDNEKQSADWARQALTNGGISPTVVAHVIKLILVTQHQDTTLDHDAQFLVDIDLAILGYSPEQFATYDEQIRAEYHWVPEPAYRRRRAQVLTHFIERARIYQTDYFYVRYEQQAKWNLSQAIQRLVDEP